MSSRFWLQRTIGLIDGLFQRGQNYGIISGRSFPRVPESPERKSWLGGELQALAKSGVNVLVSLTAEEFAELELQDEERLCGECGLRFISFPIPDRSVPFSMPEAVRTIDLILDELWAGKAVAVHCRTFCLDCRHPAQIPRHGGG